MRVFRVRFEDTYIGDDGEETTLAKRIQGKGLFPLHKAKMIARLKDLSFVDSMASSSYPPVEVNVGIVVSAFDATDGDLAPVLSSIDSFQEGATRVFQHRAKVGKVSDNHGFQKWTNLAVVTPEIIQPPYSGVRKITARVRLVDMDNAPLVSLGGCQEDHLGLLWSHDLSFEHSFEEKGYKEEVEDRDEAMALSLKIGMAVAMADGTLDDSEGVKLRDWIVRAIAPFSGAKKEHLKQIYNEAMKESYAAAVAGSLNLSQLTSRLNEIGEKSIKYEAIDLCFDVLAADGVAHASELDVTTNVATALGLDMKEIDKLRDRIIIQLSTSGSVDADESLLGIDSSWSKDQVRKHLTKEFQKWNSRLNTLSEGEERDSAQAMLNTIAEIRKRYE